MKFLSKVAAIAVGIFTLTGCGTSTPYQIIDRQDGSMQTTLFVESPAGATQGQLEGWSKELEASSKTNGKSVMINFYNGGRGPQNMVASYQGGSLYKTK